jgi:hypothetical protein
MIRYIIPIIICLFYSCVNNDYEERIQALEKKVLELDSLENNSKENTRNLTEFSKTSSSKKNIYKTEISDIDKKFIGSWIYFKSIPDANDNTMEGLICILEKQKNTKKTYVFHLWSGHDLLLSIKDDNTLIGKNANLSVKYDSKTDQLALCFSDGGKEIYKRLD